jgi:integrase
MLEKNLFPWIGVRPVSDISPTALLTTLRRTESRGALETAKRVKQVAGQAFRYAVATGRAESDPSRDLNGALSPVVKTHLAAITEPARVGPLLLALDGYQGIPIVRAALKLAPLVFTRPGELRQARWSEMDLDGAEWRIPIDATSASRIAA